MAGTYYPKKDAEFVAWLSNFLTVANANLTTLGLVAADLTPISTLQPTYSGNLSDVEAKKAALAGAVEAKDATKDSIIGKVRVIVNKIQANPTVTPSIKAQLGISTREGGQYPARPVAPTNLFAELMGDGSIKLDWNRNGNAPNTLFVIENRIEDTENFKLVDVVTKTTYIQKREVFGKHVEYAIRAKRNDELSPQSNIAVILT